MAGRDRTCAPPRFKRALYLLSYSHAGADCGRDEAFRRGVARRSGGERRRGVRGIEPTARARGARDERSMGEAGIEPAASCL